MRRSANEPLATELAGKGLDDEDDEFVYALGDQKSSQAVRKGGPKGKAPRVGELKKWLASRAQRVTDMFRSFDKNGDVTQRAYRTPSAMRACAAMRNALLALPRCCHLVESLRPRA